MAMPPVKRLDDYSHQILSWPSLDRLPRGFQRLTVRLSGQNRTAVFFWQVNPFCRHTALCEAGSEAKV